MGIVNRHIRSRRSGLGRGGFTLLEALIASVVLALIVLAVAAAVTGGQQSSYEGRKMVLAAMAGDDLLSDLSALPFDELGAFDGYTQAVGSIATVAGRPYPASYTPLGRRVVVEQVRLLEPETGARIDGKRLVVEVFDAQRVVASVEAFRPEPAP